MSVIISGTQEQFGNFFKSSENSLYSRFCIYNLFNNPTWNNAFLNNEPVNPFKNITEWIEKNHYILKENKIRFKFIEEQQIKFNKIFGQKLEYFSTVDESGNLNASIKRLGVILTRIAMVLTILGYESVEGIEILECPENIFMFIFLILDSLIENIQFSYLNLPNGIKKGLGKELTQPEKIYNCLNDSFTRNTAIEIGIKIGIKKEYIDKILKMKNYFTKTGRGSYVKKKTVQFVQLH